MPFARSAGQHAGQSGRKHGSAGAQSNYAVMDTCAACGAALPEGARFCPSCAAPVEPRQDERERKLVTVIFADLVGSTELGGSQDPERTRGLLERFYDAMAGEIDTAGGTLEKFAGDAVMAVFGAPAALEDHPERALHASLAMRRRLRELFGDAVALRIGVNTGEVVVGQPREGSSFVTGDPVNVAARLEQAAEPGEIVVGARTFATVRGAFEFSETQTVEAKGKPEGVECRRLVRALSPMRPRGVGGLHRTFVGREQEVSMLELAYADVVERRAAHMVTILGDAGVGKTSLVREFWERLALRAPDTLRRTGRCLSYGQGITYWPLGEVLKEHLGILESDPPEIVRERLGERELLGLTLGLDVAHGLHPLAARDRFQDTWVEFLDELVAEQPAVILIEDVHWAEEQLLDLLERLVRDTRGPLLLLATARPELLQDRPGWGVRLPATTIAVDALSEENASRMLDELLGATLPAGLEEMIVERAEGNPFFVEELLATLIDRGLLQPRNGSWQLTELPADFTVPDTVQAVVAARIDLLEPGEKQALQAASVIGRVFWARPVYELVEDAAPNLRVLEDRDFVRRRPGSSIAGDREYAIKHALTREVAYESLPRAKRAQLHAAFAEWLERAGSRDEHASLLAHHYAEAVRKDDADLAWAGNEERFAELRSRALDWLHRASELAIGRFEIDDGLALLQRALDLEPDEAERVELWREVGRANMLKLDGEAFWTAMLNSLEGSDPTAAADTYSELAFQTATRAAMWKRRPDAELIARWVERALELAKPESPARAKALIARTQVVPEESEETSREAAELADRLGDLDLRSWAWYARCWAASWRGDYEEAAAWAERRVDLVPQLTDPDHLSLIYLFAFDPYVAACRLKDARELVRAHVQVVARLSPHHRLHGVWNLLDVEGVAGRWEAIGELTPRAEQAVAANTTTPCIGNSQSLLWCALASTIRGDEEESERLEQSADDLGMEGYESLIEPFRVELAIARNDLAEVERKLVEWQPRGFRNFQGLVARMNGLAALDRRAEIEEEAPHLIRPGTYPEPFALRALGLVRDDDGLIERAISRFESMGLEWHAAETKRLLGGS
jgi:class 3 adenylate cyclase